MALMFAFITLQAQLVVLQYRSVPQENINEFLHRETTYWSAVAQKAIDDGKMMEWSLWQRVGGVNLDESSHNFIFANVFADKSALDGMGEIWDPSKVFPNMRPSDLETGSLSRVVHSIIMQGQGGVGRPGNFIKINYAKVSDMENYLGFETGVWQPFIDKAMKEKKTSFVGWNVANVILPGGTSLPFNAFSVDHFDSLSEAVQTAWAEDLEFPDFTSYIPTNDRVDVQVYGLVKRVAKE
jgi:hypothetical protein